jgi:hypothetical protein
MPPSLAHSSSRFHDGPPSPSTYGALDMTYHSVPMAGSQPSPLPKDMKKFGFANDIWN